MLYKESECNGERQRGGIGKYNVLHRWSDGSSRNLETFPYIPTDRLEEKEREEEKKKEEDKKEETGNLWAKVGDPDD